MTGFNEQWLALREPADIAARGVLLLRELKAGVTARTQARAGESASIVDLGAGTGSNFRHLAPHLGHGQRWCLVDHDEALLIPTRDRLKQWASKAGSSFEPVADGWHLNAPEFSATIRTLTLDLATRLDQLPWHKTDLITGSALLDLVSQSWLVELANHCQRYKCLVSFALTYDGQMQWSPPAQHDELIRAAFNRHQQRDKGFGPAMGPDAAQATVGCFVAHGFRVQHMQTDWVLDAESIELQRELTVGVANAVGELNTLVHEQIERWLQERLAILSSEQARLTVGHVDWLAHPCAS